MDADGSNIRPLHLGSDGFAFTPSPDGEFLALYAFPSGLVLGRNVDGGMAETGIGTDPDIDINPITVAWSPDSKRLAYAGDLSDDRWRYPENCGQHDCPEVGLSTAAPGKRGPFMSGHAGIFVIDADGSNHRMVVSSAAVWGSSEDARIGWSPDGKSILFADRSGVYVAAPDGSRLDRLTQVESYLPTWSPDGSQIAYVSHEVEWAPDGEQIAWRNEETGIWVMNADGTEQRQLTPSDKSATWPVWSPDGTKIAYIDDPGYQIGSIVGQDRSGPHEIWVMNSDGTAPQLVANNHGVRWTYPDGQVIQQVHWLPGPGMTPSVIPTPQEEPSVTAPWAAVSAGYEHTCAVRSGPTIACWGSAPGNPPWGNYSAVSAGRYHSCGVRSDATIACWGSNMSGKADAPRGTFTSVSAGEGHSCGVRSDATIACWGENDYGQTDAPSGTFTSVSAGSFHSCAVRSDATIACWGENDYGQTDAPSGTFTSVSAGRYHSCGVRSDATIACWGPSNTQGRDFGGRDFGQIDAPSGTFTSVSAGRYHSCGVRSDATIACWGHDGSGRIDAPSGTFTSVSAGGGHSCGVLTDSTIICWGSNNRGQAGVAGRVS